MTRTGLALLAAAGAFLLSGAAQAKAPPTGIVVCGVDSCLHLAWQEAEQFWVRAGEAGRPTGAAPFYTLRWHFDTEPEQSAYFVPSTGGMHWGESRGRWGIVTQEGVAALKRTLGALEPYPAPTLTYVTVGRRVAREPQTYLRLLAGKPTGLFPATDWLTVTMRSVTPSPWTNGNALIRLGKTAPYVIFDGWTFRIPRAVAQRARRALALQG